LESTIPAIGPRKETGRSKDASVQILEAQRQRLRVLKVPHHFSWPEKYSILNGHETVLLECWTGVIAVPSQNSES
jgi:hypothetical protein